MRSAKGAVWWFAMCCLCAAAPARAVLLSLSGPSEVQPGRSFQLLLSLEEAWPLDPTEVVDQVDVTLTIVDASTLSPTSAVRLNGNDTQPIGLLSTGFVGETVEASFLPSLSAFGPGNLVLYSFDVSAPDLNNHESSRVIITADVAPSMVDSQPLTVAHQSVLHDVTVVPEPAPWLLVMTGFGLLTFVRSRGLSI